MNGRRQRNALLQQERGRLELRIGFKTLLHRAVEQHVRERQQAHALMMRHVGADD